MDRKVKYYRALNHTYRAHLKSVHRASDFEIIGDMCSVMLTAVYDRELSKEEVEKIMNYRTKLLNRICAIGEEWF